MKKFKGHALVIVVLFLLLITVSTAFFTYNLRVVKTAFGMHIVKKIEPAFDTPYVDITGWGFKELFVFHQITREVIQAGYGSEIPQAAAFNYAVDQGITTFQQLDQRYGMTQGALDGYDWTVTRMKEMDQQIEFKQKMNDVADKAKALDEQYKISENLENGLEKAEETAKKWWEQVNSDQ